MSKAKFKVGDKVYYKYSLTDRRGDFRREKIWHGSIAVVVPCTTYHGDKCYGYYTDDMLPPNPIGSSVDMISERDMSYTIGPLNTKIRNRLKKYIAEYKSSAKQDLKKADRYARELARIT